MLRTLLPSPQCLPLCQSNFESNHPLSRTPVPLNQQSELKLYNMNEESFSLQVLPCLIPALHPPEQRGHPLTDQPASFLVLTFGRGLGCLLSPALSPLGTLILILCPFALLSTRPVCYRGCGCLPLYTGGHVDNYRCWAPGYREEGWAQLKTVHGSCLTSVITRASCVAAGKLLQNLPQSLFSDFVSS